MSGAADTSTYEIVIPTAGRPSLRALLDALAHGSGPRPARVLVVDDRRDRATPLPAAPARLPVEVLAGPAAGPAAARNAGWRAARAPWVAFLDDDVLPPPDWGARLRDDLARLGPDVAASQGRVEVPLPSGRRPTDWERNVRGLEDAAWATADMAYRRAALERLGGFDERFPRAYREDADLALRALRAGWRLERGARVVRHPVRPADWRTSVRLQAGNADDVLMRALHGRRWREEAQAPPGRLPWHLATAAAGLGALAATALRRPRLAATAGAAWAGLTADFAWRRIAPGPRTAEEVGRMALTSALVPFAAAWHRARGLATLRARLRDRARAPRPAADPGPATAGRATRAESAPAEAARPATPAETPPVEAVLLDRDGTLVVDVPYNGDPDRVAPLPGAAAALDRLRDAGLKLAVVSNQSGVARGLLTLDEVRAVNDRVDALLGPLGPWCVCPHGPGDGCACRKPRPGLVLAAAHLVGVPPERCAVIGDIGADVEAARAAGARGILVPTPVTRPEEVAAADEVASDLGAAVDLLLGARERERVAA